MKLRIIKSIFIFSALALFASSNAAAQERSVEDKQRDGLEMFRTFNQALREFYFDPNFHSADIEENYKIAREQINKVQCSGQIYDSIAQLLLELNDSHEC